jgi:hypothetical protein
MSACEQTQLETKILRAEIETLNQCLLMSSTANEKKVTETVALMAATKDSLTSVLKAEIQARMLSEENVRYQFYFQCWIVSQVWFTDERSLRQSRLCSITWIPLEKRWNQFEQSAQGHLGHWLKISTAWSVFGTIVNVVSSQFTPTSWIFVAPVTSEEALDTRTQPLFWRGLGACLWLQ